MKLHKILITLFMSVSLTACLEVDDDGNEEVAAAIQQQNELLQQQIDDATNTATLFGIVVDARDGSPVTAATLRVSSAGTVLLENVQAMQGEFSLPELPQGSTLVIEIESDTNEFLPRAFYVTTASATGDTSVDLGQLFVSVGVEKTISVTDESNEPVAGLEFQVFYQSGTGFNFERFASTSEFDEENGIYRITVPRDLGNQTAIARLDLDGDNQDDLFLDGPNNIGFISAGALNIPFSSQQVNAEIQVSRISEDTSIEFRFSIVTPEGLPLTSPTVNLQDSNVGSAVSTFDADTSQHVITVAFDGDLDFLIPAFTEDDRNYGSAFISVDAIGNDLVDVSGSTSFRIERASVINIPVSVFDFGSSALDDDASLLLATLNSDDSSYRLFFSEAVDIEEEDTSLVLSSGVIVIRGDDSDDDTVAEGTTELSQNESISITQALSLGDTQLTLTPAAPLIPRASYQYQVSDITTVRSGSINTSSIGQFFTSPESEEAFSINDVIADNNNYTTEGELIVDETTDGTANTATDDARTVELYLPLSTANLESLTFTINEFVADGVSTNTLNGVTVVSGGNVFASFSRSVSLAENETVTNGFLAQLGTAIPDGEYRYRVTIGPILSDNLDTSENSVIVEYELERSNGVEESGAITLPVL